MVLFAVVVIAAVWMWFGGSAGSDTPASNTRRTPLQTQAAAALAHETPQAAARRKAQTIDASALDVNLEALKSERPGPADAERNPFRFKPKPAPPPPPPPPPMKSTGPAEGGPPPVALPPPPPPPPPITVKLIGFVERADSTKLAVFVDCTQGRRQSQSKEGGVIDGRYRLVKIQLNSAIVEHLDGRGRTTLPVSGQECVK